jgi:hypothetical protein
MIVAQLIARKRGAAVLTAIFIPPKNIDSRKAHLAPGNFVIGKQHDNAGNPYRPVNQSNAFFLRIDPELCPTLKVKRFVLLIYCPGNTVIEQDKSSAHRGDMDRQIGSIKDKYAGIEHGLL